MLRAHRPLPSPPALIILLVVALIGGVALGVVAHGPNALDIDVDLGQAVQRMEGGPVPALADLGNLLGSTAWAAGAITVGLVAAAFARARFELVLLALLLGLRLAGTQLKPLFDSPRPTDDLVTVVGDWHGSGYPSGHALTASTMALGLAAIAWRRISSRRWALATVAVLLLLALLIGWARVWSGAHWATDVLGGWAFGTAIAAAALLLTTLLVPREAIDTDL